MNGTLPLFDSLETPTGRQPSVSGSPQASAPARVRLADAFADPLGGATARRAVDRARHRNENPAANPAANQSRHLRAAWRLSRSMWRFPDHSPEQTRAGLAICQHLQALLSQSEPPGSDG